MTAVISITGLRPSQSARRPATRAPTAQPIRIDATAKPVPALDASNERWMPKTAPFTTALSNPNRKPPGAAVAAKNATRVVCTDAGTRRRGGYRRIPSWVIRA